jgi:hypothetical protein
LPLVKHDEASTSDDEAAAWPPPALGKTMQARAAAVLTRLRGFRSLEVIKLDGGDGGEATTTKLGDLVLTGALAGDPEVLTVELRDAKRGLLQRLEVAAVTTGSAENACGFNPRLRDAYRDAATRTLFFVVRYHFRDDCLPSPPEALYAWSLDPAKGSPEAAIREVVAHQFDIAGIGRMQAGEVALPAAPLLWVNRLGSVDALQPSKPIDTPTDVSGATIQVTMSRDGKSAWASATDMLSAQTPWRASDVLIETPTGWRAAAMAWTEPKGNAEANRDAKAGKLTAGTLEGDPGDATLRAAFAKLTTDGVDATAAARVDVVAIGSGPGERSVGGPGFAKAWNAAWKGKVNVVSAIARALPSGTTGWVAATIELAKPGYKVPFTVFAVFDKDKDGAWSLVQIHFAV